MEIIHIVLGKANPARMNGVNKVVYQLATNQVLQGINAKVWGITPDLNKNFPERNFETVLFKSYRNPFKLDKSFKKEALKIKENVVFHLHGGWIPVFSTIGKFFSENNIRYVITGHGSYNTVAMNKSKKSKFIYWNLFEKNLIKAATKVHSIGKSEKNGLERLIQDVDHFLLPYGFELPDHEIVHPTSNQFIIGFVGRLTAFTKGLDILLDAFHKFEAKHTDVQLWLVGDGEDKVHLQKMVSDKKIDHVIFWGAKYDTEKDELISKMNLFVHPSRNEGLPTSVLEAASMEVPSIVSEFTNVGTYIEEYRSGMCLINNTSEELYDALESCYTLHKLNKLKEMGSNAKLMVKDAFAWKKLVNQFEALYQVG